ncbi:MAG: branched-chain amino acid transaminase [Thermoanaerobaculia bacterium]|nr:branched-chain amino acid transaminase [Thermoanaerobaculia bacterium]
MIETTEWIWHRGGWCRWQEATVHVTTHALHYGSSVYEGLRSYDTPSGPAIFRLRDHIERFERSCRLLRMDLPYAFDDLERACREVVERNGLSACYVRPLAFRGSGAMGLTPTTSPVEVTIFAFPWGRYLGEGALEEGVDVAVSSWRRIDSGSLMPQGKIGGQYINNQLASMEAKAGGFADAILLDRDGRVTEGAGQNLFLVVGEEVVTPPLSSSILQGITRDTVLTLARDLGLTVCEAVITRESLYLADELFLTGTASEITPVRSVDRMQVGSGRPGAVTRRLQEAFFAIVRAETPDRHGWLTHVGSQETETQLAPFPRTQSTDREVSAESSSRVNPS